MSITRSSRAAWRWCGRRGAAMLAVAAALLWLRVPRSADLTAEFPQHEPTKLAHFLADFTNHPKLYAHISGSWWIEEEESNLTSWRYVVGYACGPRCSGRVELLHASLASPAHGRAPASAPASDAHRLRVTDARCTHVPLLPWPQICEYTEIESTILPRAGGGARLREEARAHCGLLALLGLGHGDGACAPDAERRRHLRALRDALAADIHTHTQ